MPQPRLDWLGIGAQRAGTTWFTDLLCQHPEVRLLGGVKEQHDLYHHFPRPWTHKRAQRVLDRIDGPGCWGETTPYYLRAPWAPNTAQSVLAQDAVVFALLRDPLTRLESAVRLELDRNPPPPGKAERASWVRALMSDAIWAGMYATQLRSWERTLGAGTVTVFTWEAIRDDPSDALARVWRALGLQEISITGVDEPSRTSSDPSTWSLDAIPGLREQLVEIYRDEVAALSAVGVDTTPWPAWD